MSDLIEARQPFIGGHWVAGSGPVLQVRSPASTEVVATVETTGIDQVALAIATARTAFEEGPWPRLRPAERVAAVRALGAALAKRRGLLVETVIAEAGCPRGVTEFAQVGMALSSIDELCDLYAALPEWEHNELPFGAHFTGAAVRVSTRRF